MAAYELETKMYYGPQEAEAAVKRLHDLGFSPDEIGVMLDEKTRREIEATMTTAGSTVGLAAGGAIGGVLGAILAGITATGSVVAMVGTAGAATPLVAGPIAAALAGLGAGAAGGGIVGSLIGLGVGEKRAKDYEKGLQEGGILVAVRPRTDEDRAEIRSIFARETTTGEISSDRVIH